MSWVSPTGHSDPSSGWEDEAEAYDEDTASGNGAWGFFQDYYLWLTLGSAINCDKVRIWPYQSGGSPSIKVDVYYSGAWHNIHDGVLNNDQWNEIAIGSTQSVDKARICNTSVGTRYIREFDFNEVAGGQTHYGAATLSGIGTLASLGRLLLGAKATTSGMGSLAASGSKILSGAATMAGEGSLAAAGTIEGAIKYGAATLSGAGTLAAAGVRVLVGAATMAGAGSLAAAAVKVISGAATLSGVGSLSAIGSLLGEVFGAATLAGEGFLSVAAESWHMLTSEEYQDLLEGQIEFQEI